MGRRRTHTSSIVERVAQRLTTKHRGKFAAIDLETGRFFVGIDEVEVAVRARHALPRARFEIKRLGHPFVHILKALPR